MKCHYEVLEVARNASADEIKKAYKKLALKWHPDKNLNSVEDAKEHFQLVQLAWEVLSDPHQRAWYDKHRKAILEADNGEDYEDDSIDLFQFFTSTCFRGYGDDEKGFYTVYRNVFEKLAAEDCKFSEALDLDETVPTFGNSNSSYEEIVHKFYAYWQSYNTKVSFAWLQPYDIRQAPNRQTLRLMEKQNKKVRDSAKRERNEQVRNLVALVRKRDKRVQAHVAQLAERAKENIRKTEQWKRQQLIKRQRQLMEHKESEWSKFSNIEAELKNIEANLDQEFGDNFTSDDDIDHENVIDNNSLYCVACNKIFKTQKAFINHENSKKHKDNIAVMKASMVKEDEEFDNSQNSDVSSQSNSGHQQKLATDSQMPDFLLNSTSNANQTSIKSETSEEELMSDDEDSDNLSKAKNRIKNYSQGTKLVIGPEMDDVLYVPPKVPENDNDYITSEDELISDQEDEDTIQPKKQKIKKQKKNVQNPLIKQINDDGVNINEDILMSKKQRKKQQQKRALLNKVVDHSQLSAHDKTSECGEAVENINVESTDKFYQQGTDPAIRLQMNDTLSVHSKPNENNESITTESEPISEQGEDIVQSGKHKKKKQRKKNLHYSITEEIGKEDMSIEENVLLSKRQRKKQQQKKEMLNKIDNSNPKSQGDIPEEYCEEEENTNIKHNKNIKKIPLEKESDITNGRSQTTKVSDLAQSCLTCKAEFPSKNKLFEHLKKTGHSVYIPTLLKSRGSQEKTSKRKGNTERRNY